VVPVTAPLKVSAPVGTPLQTVRPNGTTTVGVGFTVIVKITGVPLQPFADGVTVMDDDIPVVPPLVAVKVRIFPTPVDARPMLVLLLVHVYVVPLTVLVNPKAPELVPLQKV
jgi:hypothetical protein